MNNRYQNAHEQARAWRVILSAIGFGLFLGTLLSALYIVGELFV
jgi:hypothetical protein